ncbi:phytanoyl-CoA dioxygenase family protein [Streptomyces sp. NPDC057521]|uniref:phytanoyl-CoA dioxygenase family protein n=1 Tax=Streptomyces sp. NPDC057521 TaxID=3346156 RepID=UPI003685D162
MNGREQYLFDLNGYLVVRSVLKDTELGALRQEVSDYGVDAALEKHSYLHAGFPREYYDDAEWSGADGYRYLQDSYLLDWGPAVRSLVAHPKLGPYLEALVGAEYRLDHSYGIFARGRTSSHALHNGATPFDPTQTYLFQNGQMYNSMVVVQIALEDVNEGDGGFCCIPGSHKSNFPLPADFADLDDLDEECRAQVVHVPMKAGDAVIFTEAVTHGALGWRGAQDRSALLYKYCHGSVQWEKASPFVAGDHEWTDRQRRALTGPYIGGRPQVG